MHCIDRTNELSHSKSCIERVNKYYVQCVSDNGLHPVMWLSCPSGKATTYFLTYIGLTNKLLPLKFCHLGWYRYVVWPMDYVYHPVWEWCAKNENETCKPKIPSTPKHHQKKFFDGFVFYHVPFIILQKLTKIRPWEKVTFILNSNWRKFTMTCMNTRHISLVG